ncbi:MAG TPA: hypothetical protein VK960_04455, partial [Acidimicrobiia bacterium]|nr:hypothetical protein [Acidimicrobiia bacterium]
MSVITSRRRKIAGIAALALALSTLWAVTRDEAGAGEIEVQGNIDLVYIAVATNFPDSLGVGP